MIRLGNSELPFGVMLAPMAGFSDHAMRTVCSEWGAEYSVTEMVSAKAVYFGDKKTHELSRIYDGERNVGIQIFGSEPDIMAFAAERLSKPDGSLIPSSIDINMGCPVHKIFSNGEGSALMREPELIYRIVRAVSNATSLPVTVKLRSGVDRANVNAVECALAAESGGASLVAVHGRTRVEMYSGKADRDIIKKVKESLHIPVVANGDICSSDDALSMLSDTGADGIMIGRGAIGNPFIFSEVLSALCGEPCRLPSIAERADTALRQLSIAIADKGETVAVRESRKQTALYFKGFRGAAALRSEINRAESFGEVRLAVERCILASEED